MRHRGTLGGTLAHADPAGDMPAILLALEGSVTARGPRGQREIAAADLFEDYLTSSLAPDEIITEVRLPALDGYGFGYQKFNRRGRGLGHGRPCPRWSRGRADGSCEDVRVGARQHGLACRCGRPRWRRRCGAARSTRRPSPPRPSSADEGTDPPEDLNATADYKRHLARVLTRRALEEAAAGA